MKNPRGVLTEELIGAVRAHKPALLALADLRADFARLSDYCVKLRCQDPPKGTRAAAIAYLAGQIEKMAARCDLEDEGGAVGFTDPGDPFGGEQVLHLRHELEDLRRQDAPYPLGPIGEDPFSMNPPRRYNGRLT